MGFGDGGTGVAQLKPERGVESGLRACLLEARNAEKVFPAAEQVRLGERDHDHAVAGARCDHDQRYPGGVVSVSAAVSNQMKMAVCPAV